MEEEAPAAPMFVATGGPGVTLSVSGEYDPGIGPEVDRAIRNMPGVVAHCTRKANELLKATGSSNFEVIVSKNPAQQRPRAYVCPSNSEGIREELADAVLLKSALGMAGK
jgi:hypothetical protein